MTATVDNPAPVRRHVRLENRLDGPALPPRSNGVPERGWDEDGVTLTVPPNATCGVGYACRSPPIEPPIEIETTGRGAAPEDPAELRARRSLGPFRPPRAVVTGIESGSESGVDDASDRIRDGGGRTDDGDDGDDGDVHDGDVHDGDVDDAARRVELGRRLAAAGVEEATDVLEILGETDLVDPDGIAGAKALAAGLDDDASTLDRQARRLAARADRLRRAAERAESDADRARERAELARTVEVPIDALGSFA